METFAIFIRRWHSQESEFFELRQLSDLAISRQVAVDWLPGPGSEGRSDILQILADASVASGTGLIDALGWLCLPMGSAVRRIVEASGREAGSAGL